MQIVYISNRPELMFETLEHVAALMPFIDEAVICVPTSQVERFQCDDYPLSTRIIEEHELLNQEELAELPLLDHQRRNYLLRTRLAAHEYIDAAFIMSDDDSRPLLSISLDQFLSDGKYRNYYFYELARWENNQTDFDCGQISTHAVLAQNKLEALSYACHMPQIIDRDLFLEAASFFEEYAKRFPLCEWSSYFNYAIVKHSDKFHSPEAFLTLCWPEHPRAWRLWVQPSCYLFENFTPSLYRRGGPFSTIKCSTISAEDSSFKAVEKIIVWRQYSINSLYPEQAKTILKYLNPRTWINKLRRY